MYTLTIAPLSVPGHMSAAAAKAIREAERLFVQTEAHPSARWIGEEGLRCTAMDDLYAQSEDFDALNAAIADRLCSGDDAVYAVTGGGVGEALLCVLRARAEENGFRLRLLPGISYAQAAMAQAGFCAENALCTNAMTFSRSVPDPGRLLCVEDVDTALRAGELKLFLGEYYPDESPVCWCVMDAQTGAYTQRSIALYELDRQPAEEYFAATVAIVPPLGLLERKRHALGDLLNVLRRLRAPGGCPWDAKQDHASLRGALLEESYECLQCIDDADMDGLCEELGDLLLQIAFHAVIEEERRAFTMRDVISGVVNKLIFRHPHVFANAKADTAEEVLINWEALKKEEKRFKSQSEMIDAIPRALPALMRSAKVQKKAADVGFDWPSADGALDKVGEELAELRAAIAEAHGAHIEEEMGDLLFACVNAARLLHTDAELLLQRATDKFSARFRAVEEIVAQEGKKLQEMTLPEMDMYWDAVKKKNTQIDANA